MARTHTRTLTRRPGGPRAEPFRERVSELQDAPARDGPHRGRCVRCDGRLRRVFPGGSARFSAERWSCLQPCSITLEDEAAEGFCRQLPGPLPGNVDST